MIFYDEVALSSGQLHIARKGIFMSKPKHSVCVSIVLSWLCFAIGLVLGICKNPDLFHRFGSLMVLFAIYSEYLLLKWEQERLNKKLKGLGAATAGGKGIPDQPFQGDISFL